MEKNLKVIVDTDILIKAYRGDNTKINNLKLLSGRYCISVITAIELIAGAKSIRQLSSMNKVLKIYSILHVNEIISAKTFQLYKEYTLKNILGLSDCFIAATALQSGLKLYTDNKKDYKFFERLEFYNEK